MTLKNFVRSVNRFLASEDGPTAVEYSVMLGLIIVVCLAAVQSVGQNTSDMYNDIATDIGNMRTGTVD